MKTSIKTAIGIIIIAVSSISLAQAGDRRSERDHDRNYDRSHSRSYEQPRHKRHYRKHERRHHWKRFGHRKNHYRAPRHFNGKYYRKHQRYNKHHRGYNRVERHDYHHTTYVTPRYAPSHRVVITNSDHALPVLAGTLIGSAIANDASNGDPAATFGGAVFGAIVGNALAHH